MKKTCIIVTGMHRSGTSMMAGILHHCGIYTGTCIQPDQYNEKGYFEDKAVLEINKKLLPDWKNPKLKPMIINYSFDDYPDLFFLKDPRFCFTAPIWIEQFKEIDFKIIKMIREKQSIIDSLSERDGENNWGDIIDLYLESLSNIKIKSKHWKYSIFEFNYELVINNPIGFIESIFSMLPSVAHLFEIYDRQKILDFVDRRLKHY